MRIKNEKWRVKEKLTSRDFKTILLKSIKEYHSKLSTLH
ncbi:hypothetical protein CLH_2389 [Clostridium botulinum E3 str. Alaska E43]|nr:hypothetical protein CLH_2389 [Clostridium botulinum E3 str. Alaska E43]